MKFDAAGTTDVGRSRDHNEDFFVCRPDLGLFAVCDGMGGHAAGEVAAEMAGEALLKGTETLVRDLAEDEVMDRHELKHYFRAVVERASRKIFEHAKSEYGRAGMGTTLTAMFVHDGRAVMAHVGDSRLYLLRNGEVVQLSDDHSYVNEMVKRGLLDLEAAKASPYANVITRGVGIHNSVEVDVISFDVLAGDTYLVCSDGLYRYFDDDESDIVGFLSEDDVAGIGERLVSQANERGGKDNITAVVVRCDGHPDDDPRTEEIRSTKVNLCMDTLRYVSLFQHLKPKELLKLLEILRVESARADEVIIRQGEEGSALYVILEGSFSVERDGEVLAELKSGAHFGEMSLLNARPRSATVTATTEGRLMVMDQVLFEELVRVESRLGVKLLWTFSQVLSLRLDAASQRRIGRS